MAHGGVSPEFALTGTRESEQPIHSHSGAWLLDRLVKNVGSFFTMFAAHALKWNKERHAQEAEVVGHRVRAVMEQTGPASCHPPSYLLLARAACRGPKEVCLSNSFPFGDEQSPLLHIVFFRWVACSGRGNGVREEPCAGIRGSKDPTTQSAAQALIPTEFLGILQ